MALSPGGMLWSYAWSRKTIKPSWPPAIVSSSRYNEQQGGLKMRFAYFALFLACGMLGWTHPAVSQEGHDHMKNMDKPANPLPKASTKSALRPAEGARVKIMSPKAGQVLTGDKVPLEFKLTKG